VLVAIYNVEDTERVRARRLTITEPRITIGRAPTCTIVVDDDVRVIEHHLEIELRATSYIVTPRGTTSVNGTVISGPTTCALGDTVQLGNTIVKLRAEQKLVKTLSRHERRTPVHAMPGVLPEGPSGNPPPPAWNQDEVTPQQSYGLVEPLPPSNPPRPQSYGPHLPTQLVAPTKIFRDRLSRDEAEHALLATLRDKPDELGARLVYADWLEDHGFLVRALITRGEQVAIADILEESTAEWRAIASCASTYDCTRTACPRQWSRFAATLDDERLRTCGTCSRTVRYCLHTLDPQGAVARGESVVLDTALEIDSDMDAGDTLDDSPPR
jgi:uncharacterized protein (TIGR02996 family)